MLSDIMIGQFFPADSIIHRMDARVKILMLFVFILSIFLFDSKFDYVILIMVSMGLVFISQIPLIMYIKSLKPMFWIVLFTFIVHVFSGTGPEVFKIWLFSATWNGIYEGLFITIRLLLLVLLASVLTFTTSPLVLTDALEALLRPFKAIGVPAHELSMMMTIALRFIPTLINETDKIIKAQKSRGADFTSGSIINRIHFVMPILIPLFVGAFRRADELALAMEARYYRGGEGRTRMKEMQLTRLDYILIGLFSIMIVILAVLKVKGI
ncbi:energy-coupling factor transporter transmembrane component T family protein [Pectinatus sottacetonis]|uniref:energy-coupling factor transporter transmembrane component T family protein n=1 Tax=Pectinatus sottacetonis TaxID=1002795 RepID=UPI0018C6EAF7|nr:energy-coupling factor transporter transmembrane component T [Pectinatus sottacetonis]